MLKPLFGRNASDDERAKQFRKLNEALQKRAEKHVPEDDVKPHNAPLDKSE